MKNREELQKLAEDCERRTAILELEVKGLLEDYLEDRISDEELEPKLDSIEMELNRIQGTIDYIEATLGEKMKESDLLDINEN